ncbi:FUSC family protein [Cohnella caldifontis]|uniref:FUSC family protein n=1 Tax=Cohnella caldifontis TaxID=3027471 RepID=UPI0023EBDD99|nr:FUSC family protein [Cohnella sp. YIM B05605]
MMKKFHLLLSRTNLVWKMALASSVAWEAARAAGSHHPYLAPLSVILCLRPTVEQTVRFGIQRVLGTIAGVLAAVSVVRYVGMNAWSLGLMILAANAAAYGMGFKKSAMDQVAFSILLVLYFQTRFPSYGLDRVRDTAVGCAIVLIFHVFVYPPDFTKKAVQALYAFTDQLSARFDNAAERLERGCPADLGSMLQKEGRKLFDELKKTADEFGNADRSLRYHPFVRKSRTILQQFDEQSIHLKQGYAHLTGMLRTLAEWSQSGNMSEEDRKSWAERMSAAASLIREWKRKMQMVEQGKGAYFIPGVDASILEKPPDSTSRSAGDARFAYALHNDSLQLLHDFTEM